MNAPAQHPPLCARRALIAVLAAAFWQSPTGAAARRLPAIRSPGEFRPALLQRFCAR